MTATCPIGKLVMLGVMLIGHCFLVLPGILMETMQ